MHPITVREARMADLDSVERFQQGVVSAERPYDPTLKDGTVKLSIEMRMPLSDE
jgi:hypothetical protein